MLLKTRLNNVNIHSLLKLLVVTPLIVVTDYIIKAFGMSLVMFLTLVLAELIISAMKKLIDVRLRHFIYIIITAFTASVSAIILKLILPDVAASLGVYLSMVAVSCLVIIKLETVASVSSVAVSLTDAVVSGGEFALIMLATAFVREFLGNGTLLSTTSGGGLKLFTAPFPILKTTIGLLIIMSFGAAFMKYLKNKKSTEDKK